MPINPTTLKASIDTQITNETVDFAITPSEVGGRMKDCVDYTTEQAALKENLITATTSAQYYRGDKTFATLNKAAVNLANADNTSDANKPISTATQVALDLKENLINPTTSAQYYRGDKTFATLNKAAVNLASVDNTSDANKPISIATQTALNTKQNTLVSGTNIKTINGASVLGSGDLVVDANETPDATTTVKGKIKLAGDLAGTADLPTVVGLANKEVLSNKSTNVTTDGASDTKYPSVKAVKTYVDANIVSGQTLQQITDNGNTITSGGNTTRLTSSSIKVGESSTSGMTLNSSQLIFEKSGGTELMLLQFPTALSGIKQITLPNSTGTIALTSQLPTVSGDYINDAAAAAGGILVGGLYHTSGVVKIRLV